MRRLALFLLLVAGLLAGCDDRTTLVGTWRPAAADSLGARYTFLADGRARIVTRPPGGEAQVYEARYALAGDTLLTLEDGQGRERFRMRLTGDTLWLQSPVTGMDTRLARVRGR